MKNKNPTSERGSSKFRIKNYPENSPEKLIKELKLKHQKAEVKKIQPSKQKRQ